MGGKMIINKINIQDHNKMNKNYVKFNKVDQTNIFMFINLIIFCMLSISTVSAETIAQPPSNFTESGAGRSADNPYLISNLANLRWLSETVSAWGTYTNNFFYKQTANIDATETVSWNEGAGFSPIGGMQSETSLRRFVSHFDGSGYVISNLYINRPNLDRVGLFGLAGHTVFKNIILENVNITGNENVGGLFGALTPNFENAETILSNSSVTGVVKGNIHVGGVAGWIFHNTTKVYNNYAKVDVVGLGEESVGGFAGTVVGSYLKSNYATGNVTGDEYVGGLIGIAALISPGSKVEDCYATGDVVGNLWVGGLIGIIWGGTVSNCYSLGQVTGNEHVGELVGLLSYFAVYGIVSSEGFLTNSVYNIGPEGLGKPVGQQSPYSHIIDVVGKTSREMQLLSIYTDLGWDFENVWDMAHGVNDGYPFLRNMGPSLNTTDPTIPKVSNMLLGNYPNPFNPETTISFVVATGNRQQGSNTRSGDFQSPKWTSEMSATSVRIDIYNVKGQKVRSLVNGLYPAGEHSVVWNGADDNGVGVGSGIYLYRMTADGASETRKMVLIK